MFITLLALTLGASTQLNDATMQGIEWPNDLAVAPLMGRRSEEAIAVLEQSRSNDPEDPAVLINLGIAYAQLGREDEARALFSKAQGKRIAHDLATSDGRVTDSRQVARRAIRMLDQGEFRSGAQGASQLTLRD